jgi:hypothetical protein
MKPEEIILSELQEVAPTLANISKQMPFEIPDGYFEIFPMLMLEQVAPTPIVEQDVPEGYFNSFPEMMLQKMRSQEVLEETESIAPLLNSISKSMPNHLPEKYFEQLQPQVETNIVPVVSIKRKVWMQIAAAVVVMLAAFGVWQMTQNSNAANGGIEIASSNDTIEIPAEISLQLAMMDESVIESEFGTTGQSVEASNSVYYLETENFEEALKEFSVDDISTQLSETPIVKKSI